MIGALKLTFDDDDDSRQMPPPSQQQRAASLSLFGGQAPMQPPQQHALRQPSAFSSYNTSAGYNATYNTNRQPSVYQQQLQQAPYASHVQYHLQQQHCPSFSNTAQQQQYPSLPAGNSNPTPIHQQATTLPPPLSGGAGSSAGNPPLNDDASVVATLEMWRAKVTQQMNTMQSLDDEERMIDHEEAALRRQLEDITHTRHRQLDKQLMDTQHGWHDLHRKDMSLRCEHPPDLSPQIAEAEAKHAAAKEQHDQIAERLALVEKQLQPFDGVEARREELEAQLTAAQKGYEALEERRRRLLAICQRFMDIESRREASLRQVSALLDVEDDEAAAVMRKKNRSVRIVEKEPSVAMMMPAPQPPGDAAKPHTTSSAPLAEYPNTAPQPQPSSSATFDENSQQQQPPRVLGDITNRSAAPSVASAAGPLKSNLASISRGPSQHPNPSTAASQLPSSNPNAAAAASSREASYALLAGPGGAQSFVLDPSAMDPMTDEDQPAIDAMTAKSLQANLAWVGNGEKSTVFGTQ